MKILFILSLFLSVIFAKSCYWIDRTQFCYKRYYNTSNLKVYHKNIRYYIKDHKVYSLGDTIKVKLKFNGALFMLLDDFDLDFVDVGLSRVYTFKLKDYDELFSILTNLNKQSYIKYAKPIIRRVYRKGEKKALIEKKLKDKEKKDV